MRTIHFFVLGILLTAPITAGASSPKRVVLRDHPRLRRIVTLEERRIELGALFDRLSDKTVKIEASDRITPVSGYQVTAVLKDRPLWEVLEGTVRLYSTKSDPWYWTSEGSAPLKLVLHNSTSPAAFRLARQQFVDDYLLAQRRRLQEFYGLPKEKRQQAAAKERQLQAHNNPRSELFFSFHAKYSEDAIRGVLHGRRMDIPVSDLTEAQRRFIRDEYERSNLLGQSDVEPPEKLEVVTLSSLTGQVMPSLFLEIGAVGGHAVLGGIWLEAAKREAVLQDWLGRGEDQKAEDLPIPAPDVKTQPGDYRIGSTRDDTLFRLARISRINLLLDNSDRGPISSDRNLAGRLPDVLGYMDRLDLMWKRWEPLYLLRNTDAELAHREHYVPYPVLRSLRASAAENAGFLRPQDWLRLSSLAPEQLENLVEEFADSSEILKYQSLFRLAAAFSADERNALARPGGAGWDDWSTGTRSRLQQGMGRDRARTFRVHVRFETDKRPPAVRLWAEDGQNRVPLTIVPFMKRGEERPPLFPRRTE